MNKYPKLVKQKDCAYPKREQCNYSENYKRCEYMKYNNSKSISDPTRWECTFKKCKYCGKKEELVCCDECYGNLIVHNVGNMEELDEYKNHKNIKKIHELLIKILKKLEIYEEIDEWMF